MNILWFLLEIVQVLDVFNCTRFFAPQSKFFSKSLTRFICCLMIAVYLRIGIQLNLNGTFLREVVDAEKTPIAIYYMEMVWFDRKNNSL